MPSTSTSSTVFRHPLDIYVLGLPARYHTRTSAVVSYDTNKKTVHPLPSTNDIPLLSEYYIDTTPGEKLHVYAAMNPVSRRYRITDQLVTTYTQCGYCGFTEITIEAGHALVFNDTVGGPTQEHNVEDLPDDVQSFRPRGDLGWIFLEPHGAGQMRKVLHPRSSEYKEPVLDSEDEQESG